MAIIDLTGTTWVFDTTQLLNYGNLNGQTITFNVNYITNGKDYQDVVRSYEGTTIDFKTNEAGGSLTQFKVAWETGVANQPVYNGSAWQWFYQNGLSITIYGGADATNSTLIAFFEANATQQISDESTTITYNSVTSKLERGKTATLACNGKKMKSDIVVAFGSTGAINYDGTSTGVESRKTATVQCSGKKMLSDVVIKTYIGDVFEEEITDSWERIMQSIEDGDYKYRYRLGSYKPVTLTTGEVMEMQIIGFDKDVKSDGTGTAAITFLSKNLYSATSSMQANYNSLAPNWSHANCKLRNLLRGTIYNSLPDDLKEIIVPVTKTFNTSSGASSSCSDTLWVPSVRELTGDTTAEQSGFDYTEFFKNDASRIKSRDGVVEPWYTRSVRTGGSVSYYYFVSERGYTSLDTSSPYYKKGVVVGFCIG